MDAQRPPCSNSPCDASLARLPRPVALKGFNSMQKCAAAPEALRILFLIRSLDHGGAERQLALLARELKRRGHRVAVAVFYAGGPLTADMHAAGIELIDLGKKGRWDILPFLGRLAGLVRRMRPHILHGYLPVSDILATLVAGLAGRGTRLVFGVRASDMDLSRYDRLAALAYRLEARLARFADAAICNSAAGRRAVIERGFPPGICEVVPNGVDVGRFRCDRALGQGLRRAWGIAESEKLVGMVGRVDPMKGREVFIRAVAEASRRDPTLRFVSVGGTAAERSGLEALAAQTGAPIRWVDGRDDMVAVYNALDLFVLPSLYGEGFPNVLAEAMACGLACVASDVGDAAIMVEGLGTVVPPGDSDALARAILTADKDIVPEAIRRVHEDYSAEALANRTEAILTALVYGRRAKQKT